MNPLISRLLNIFGEPECPDPDAYLTELASAINGASDSLMKAAGDRIVRTHRGRAFPTIGVVMAAFDEERSAASIGTVPSSDWRRYMPPVPVADYSDETKERWRKAAEFQKAMAEKHGTFDAFLKATRHLRDDCEGKKPLAAKSSTMKSLSDLTRAMTGDRE